MKTAAAIHERSVTPGLKRMAETLVDQLVEIMPELKDVSPWHTYGQRRSLEEFGRVMERRCSDSVSGSTASTTNERRLESSGSRQQLRGVPIRAGPHDSITNPVRFFAGQRSIGRS